MSDEFQSPPFDPALRGRLRFVLVEPSHPGNIGAAARALKNMGLGNLVLVNPQRFPDPEARFRAASAVELVDGATVVSSLAQAIDDTTLVIGTSARSRRVPWPMVTARSGASLAHEELQTGEGAKVAFVFGREASGLTNDELARCQHHMMVETDPAYPSLNLSMAVQLVAYELRMAWLEGARPPEPPWDRPWASSEALEHFMEHLDRMVDHSGFLADREPGQVRLRLRRLFFRTRLDQVEVNILRGVFTGLERALYGVARGGREKSS